MAVTSTKIESNRQNATKSTGPITPEGKAAVANNAIKHGLSSRRILLPGESQQELNDLSESLRSQLQPQGGLENLLFERIVSLTWRLLRLSQIEKEILQEGRGNLLELVALNELGMEIAGTGLGYGFTERSGTLNNLPRYEAFLDKSFYKALHELQRLQANRHGLDVPLPVAVDVNVTAADNF